MDFLGKYDIDLDHLMSRVTTKSSTGESVSIATESEPILVAVSASATSGGQETNSYAIVIT